LRLMKMPATLRPNSTAPKIKYSDSTMSCY
jgi:hypothetical protein